MRSLLFLSEPGVALQSRRGALCVRDGDGTETHYTPRVHKLKTIILAGHGESITSEAIRWCGREGVALFLMERNGECVAVLADAPECDARRRALAIASGNGGRSSIRASGLPWRKRSSVRNSKPSVCIRPMRADSARNWPRPGRSKT